ncbi:MAG: hypothetical protein JW940_31950 [Polyangiaceae bacterium]|nr:hypothetical protein [Polyangiaceae bacterium]
MAYDAGACSAANALAVRQRGYHYLLGLKGNQPDLLREARRWLGNRTDVDATARTSSAGIRLFVGRIAARRQRPITLENPRATVVVAMPHRIAHTLLTLFRSVTQRSDERRHTPWKRLINSVFRTLIGSDLSTLADLQRHPVPV